MQFTPVIAFHCVLHRCENQEIHCWKLSMSPLFLYYGQCLSLSTSSTETQEMDRIMTFRAHHPTTSRVDWLSTWPITEWYGSIIISRERERPWTCWIDKMPESHHTKGFRPIRASQWWIQPCEPTWVKKKKSVCSPQSRGVCMAQWMILPQVHLRKPCYDFYFL